jgi:hypothetical protein
LDPVLPLSPGRAERHGFEYYRHGTLSLYAALDVKTGKVQGKTAKRPHQRRVRGLLATVETQNPVTKIAVGQRNQRIGRSAQARSIARTVWKFGKPSISESATYLPWLSTRVASVGAHEVMSRNNGHDARHFRRVKPR